MFSDDVNRTFDLWEERLDKRTDDGKSRVLFNKIKDGYEGCLSLHTKNKETNNISAVFTIIDVKSHHAQYCMAANFYKALGLYGYSEGQPFSFLSDKNQQEIKFTKLDKFLLFLLYQEEFKSGMQQDEIKNIFEKVYDRSKKDFLQKIEITENKL